MSGQRPRKGVLAFLLLVLMAIGIVFGDIGTSPLYTEGEIFFPSEGAGVPLRDDAGNILRDNVIGANSSMLWFLYTIVGVCYCMFALRADHHGEGGVLALFAKLRDYPGRLTAAMGLLLILGTGLLMGDGAITPPISIMGGLEGLAVATTVLEPWIVPLAIFIIVILFAFQHRGTATIGLSFGPIMTLWFISIALIGAALIREDMDILLALNPWYGIKFLFNGGSVPIKIHYLGGAMLAITGGEALYADLGHFSKNSIRAAFGFVVCCLTLNYLGQGAFLLTGGEVHEGNVFYSSVRSLLGQSGLYAMIVVGTSAAIIASQALITGLFSLVALAIALRLMPKVLTQWTSEQYKGQIYQRSTNWILCVFCVLIVLLFPSTKKLAPAYGLAVSLLMLFTCLNLGLVAVREWGWRTWKAVAVFGPFAVIETAFVAANSVKFVHGGWFPVLIGSLAFAIMTTWQWGGRRLGGALSAFAEGRTVEWLVAVKNRLGELRGAVQHEYFFAAKLIGAERTPVEIDRCLLFLTSRPIRKDTDTLPASVWAVISRYGFVAREMLLFHVSIDPDRARLNGDERIELVKLGPGLNAVILSYGYMEVRDVDVRGALRVLRDRGELSVSPEEWTIEVGEEEIKPGHDLSRLNRLRLAVYKFIRMFATPAHHFFGLKGEAVSKTVVTVRFTRDGAEVDMRTSEPFAGGHPFTNGIVQSPLRREAATGVS